MKLQTIPMEVIKSIKNSFGTHELDIQHLKSILPKVRFEMGADIEDNKERLNQVMERSEQIFELAFRDSKKIWIFLEFFSDRIKNPDIPLEFKNLINCGYKVKENDIHQLQVAETDEKNYYRYIYAIQKEKKFRTIESILYAIAGAEIGIRPTAFLRSYFIDFDKEILFHLYDDRGLDIASKDKNIIRKVSEKYKKWISG
ncbi:MAG: DUF3885 domain-containing protein [bacterium]|nr:DUF3885 domain-containing protein [bacterium]